MPDSVELGQLRTLAAQSADERLQTLRDRTASRRELADVQARLAQIGDPTSTEATSLVERRNQLATTVTASNDALRKIEEALREAGERFIVDPCDASVAEPLLLLPVRLETRFRQSNGATQLMIRIYPDTVHIDRLKRSLSADEQVAGQDYWTALWNGVEAATAWAALVAATGRSRAGWVARSSKPSNQPPGDAPVFAPAGDIVDEGAVARLLPDRFVAEARQNGKIVRGRGATIAGNPRMGLFMTDDGEDDVTLVNGVPVSPGSEWIADYAEAEKAGMAVTLVLPSNAAVERLYVFGVRQSLAPAAAAQELETLLTAHRFSDGVGFVPQGTPTNSIDGDRAGAAPVSSVTPPTFDEPSVATGNAARLASALGIGGGVLAGTDHADGDEDRLARAANLALWWPSWGNFLAAIDTSVQGQVLDLSDQQIETVRRFHRDFVRGRGPLPTLRLGKQPYGILPVGATDQLWQLSGFDAKMIALFKRVRAIWRQSLDNVPRLGVGAVDKTTLELLGSSPVGLGVRARAVVSKATFGAGVATGTVNSEQGLETLLNQLIWQQVANASLMTEFFSLDAKSKPVGLPLADDSDPARLAAIAANPKQGGEVKSILQALAALGMAHARDTSKRASVVDFDQLVAAADGPVKVAAQANSGLAASLAAGSARNIGMLLAASDTIAESTGAVAAIRNRDFNFGVTAGKSFAEMSQAALNDSAKAELSGFALGDFFRAFGTEQEVHDALGVLAAASTADRTLVTAEALDIASHRLDAWLTAAVEQRRVALRAATPQGINVGAYGYLEDIRPNAGSGDFGFVHAPSPEQAITAGLLRSAYLSHAKEGGDGAFAIDLSSARVRDAMDLLDAMRSGQGLGEALGYRIERALHAGKIDRVVRNLRRFAPVRLGKLTDSGEAVDDGAQENIAAASVVDGVALVDVFKKSGITEIAKRAFAVPADNPYLLPGSWPLVPTPREEDALLTAITAAAASLDAASDLLLAESVHQMAQGNMARASAALDAGSTGDAPPPAPAVVTTPAAGGSLIHRVMLVLGTGAGWGPNSPRSVAEPRLEAWAAARLGPRDKIVVASAPDGTLLTLAQLDIAAIDFVFATADPAGLTARVLAAHGLASGLADIRDPAWPAGMQAVGDVLQTATQLRRILASASVAVGKDLTTPHDDIVREPSPASLDEALERAKLARETLSLRIAAQAAPGVDREAWLVSMADLGIFIPGRGARDEVVRLVLEQASQRLTAVDKILAKPVTQAMLTDAAQAIFGDGFWIIAPLDAPAAPDAWDTALQGLGSLAKPSAVRRWLADLGSVRAGVRDYADSLLLSEAIGAAPQLAAVQLRNAATDVLPAADPGPPAWAGAGPATGIAASWVVEVPAGYGSGQPTAALILDSHVEALVDRERRTTGVAFNAPSPSARPPQSWLLAVAPDATRWTSDAVLATIVDTVELAKLRGLTLERLKTAPRILPALYQNSHSLQGDDLVFQFLDVAATAFPTALAFVKET